MEVLVERVGCGSNLPVVLQVVGDAAVFMAEEAGTSSSKGKLISIR